MANLKMPDINNVLVAGNLTCDPSFRKTTNGTPVANFFIASNRKFKDNNGQWRENVCYVGVVAWYKLAESCFENIQKGSAVIIDGELQSRSWRNDDGSSRNVVEIKARRIQFLNRKDGQREELETDEFSEMAEKFECESSEFITGEIQEEAVLASEEKTSSDENKEEIEDKDYDFGYSNLNL
ncbi:single-stranded DNA-binding protein [candidate division KSB1 bacterium]|nr:single-stranded DNA-binding protein [candidate division KSB1 bacterium]